MRYNVAEYADYFIPPSILNDPERRRSAMRFRGVARMLLICIAVELFFIALIGSIGGLEYIVVLGAVGLSAISIVASLFLMRFLETFILPLVVANGGSVVFIALGVLVSGGIYSPLIYLFLTIPALSISFGTRSVFLGVCITISFFFVAVYLLQVTEVIEGGEKDRIKSTVQFLYLMGAFTLSALGGLSAQISSTQSRRALREKNRQLEAMAEKLNRSNSELADKNSMLEALSSKLAKYLSPQLFSSIFEGKQDVKIGATRKKLTVYFSDVVDFTATTDSLEAEELSALMNEYFEEMARVIIRHGGTIDKYMGDAIMVFFGDPESRGEAEDARACVAMALELQERLVSLQTRWRRQGIERPLQMRAGINSGYCTVGNFGSENRMDYTIIGGQVNIAARLEQAASPGEVLISHQTHALVSDFVVSEPYAELTVKGIAEPIKAYQVTGLKAPVAKTEVIDEKLDGLSLFADVSVLTNGDRLKAIELLQQTIGRLEQEDVGSAPSAAQ